QEDYALGKATERVFLPLLKTLIHDIVDYHLPLFGCFHNCAFVRIDKAYPLQARRVMHAIWGAGQMAWTKFIVVVDADVDVHDEWAVWEAVAARTRFDRDLEFVRGPLDILDHAAPRLGAGTKFGIDATRKIRGEDAEGIAWDAPIARAPEVAVDSLRAKLIGVAGIRSIAKLDGFGGPRLIYATVAKKTAGDGGRAIEAIWDATPAGFGDCVFIAAHEGDGEGSADPERVLFQVAANACPRRDAWRRGERIGFDGTPKVAGEERVGEAVRDFPPGVGGLPVVQGVD
ncbi:MAG: UbiD family decarboxylase, partial [Planctomycetes bacterium]|nr:UbiD family decarboxylase [Planctomycetota bacterium]